MQVSKRMFDGRIRSWRRALHKWDDPNEEPIQLHAPPTKLDEESPLKETALNDSNDEVEELLRSGTKNSKLLDSILNGKDIDSDDDVL